MSYSFDTEGKVGIYNECIQAVTLSIVVSVHTLLWFQNVVSVPYQSNTVRSHSCVITVEGDTTSIIISKLERISL